MMQCFCKAGTIFSLFLSLCTLSPFFTLPVLLPTRPWLTHRWVFLWWRGSQAEFICLRSKGEAVRGGQRDLCEGRLHIQAWTSGQEHRLTDFQHWHEIAPTSKPLKHYLHDAVGTCACRVTVAVCTPTRTHEYKWTFTHMCMCSSRAICVTLVSGGLQWSVTGVMGSQGAVASLHQLLNSLVSS